jgi:MFS transporter, PAT family, beta-lactamase induction signal transducer AmpG
MEQTITFVGSLLARYTQLLKQQRLVSILLLGFASGLPLLLTGSTLQAWFATSHIDIVSIGVLTLVGQPYVYKFIWAPLLDRFALPFLGRRRGWVLLLQISLVISIAMMGLLQPDREPMTLGLLALWVAFLSASQDIAIDAYRTDLLSPSERGLGAALNTIGYRVAMLVTGAVALVFADYLGWKVTYLLMAGLMLLEILVTIWAPNPQELRNEMPKNLTEALTQPFNEFLNRKAAISILLFIILYKLGDVFTLALGTTFLIRGVGFNLTEIGLIYKLIGMLGLFAGVFVGGLWMRRITLFKALLFFGIIQALTNLPFMFLALIGKNYSVLIFTIFSESFGSGLGSVAFLSFIMSLCDHRYTATQFALFSALAAVGRVFVGPIAGMMVEHLGWVQFYFWAFIIGLPGLLLLGLLKSQVDFGESS